VKKYIEDNQIEESLDESVNKMLELMPTNPYSYLTRYFSDVYYPLNTIEIRIRNIHKWSQSK